MSISHKYIRKFIRAGSVIENMPNALPVPPVSIILKQQIIDVPEGDGKDESAKVPHLQRDLLAISGSVCHDKLSIHCFDVSTRTKSPSIGKRKILDSFDNAFCIRI